MKHARWMHRLPQPPLTQFPTPDVAVDNALSRNIISPTLPLMKSLAVDTLSRSFPTAEARTRAFATTCWPSTAQVPGCGKAPADRTSSGGYRPDRHLRPERLSEHEMSAGRPIRTTSASKLDGLLPLPRRKARCRRRDGHHPRLQGVPHGAEARTAGGHRRGDGDGRQGLAPLGAAAEVPRGPAARNVFATSAPWPDANRRRSATSAMPIERSSSAPPGGLRRALAPLCLLLIVVALTSCWRQRIMP